MGLYQGLSLDKKSVLDAAREPDMVFLYRRAILDYWMESGDETLGEIITHVLVHEIGHHFGFSDDDMEEIEEQAGAVTRAEIPPSARRPLSQARDNSATVRWPLQRHGRFRLTNVNFCSRWCPARWTTC